VTQNVFLEIFRAAAQFDPSKGTTKTWILQYAYHRSLNRRQQLNTRHFYQERAIEDYSEKHTPENGSLFGRLSRPEIEHLLRQALAKLGRQQRRVLELASYDGLSLSEIAEKTGDSVSNVRHYYYRGLKKLRSLITGEEVGRQPT
jgi:RNA polymerase sigma-70 factor, ECF subfamily